MATTTGVPVTGTDAVGTDTYAAVLAAPTAPLIYKHVILSVQTKDAIVSFDGGTTDGIRLLAGEQVILDDVYIQDAIQGKNAVGGDNYTFLTASAW